MQVAPTRFPLLDLFEAAYGANLIGCTITRIRGRIWLAVPPAATLQFRAGFKVTDNATPPDASENLYRQDEFGGAHDDWFGWYVLAGGPDPSAPPQDMAFVDVDVRSARKIDELGERLDLYISAFTGLVEAAGTIAFDLSILVKLP